MWWGDLMMASLQNFSSLTFVEPGIDWYVHRILTFLGSGMPSSTEKFATTGKGGTTQDMFFESLCQI